MSQRLLKTVGSNIRKHRIAIEKSQGELATDADLTREYINKLEAGKVNISITRLEKIAKALKIKITEIFS